MQWPKDLLRNFVHTCVGRTDTYALRREDGRYYRELAPLTPDLLLAHLSGKLSVGTYLVTEWNRCRFVVFGSAGPAGLDRLVLLQRDLATLGLPSYLQSIPRGVSLWLFMQSECPSALVRRALLPLCPDGVELYPRQDQVTWDAPGSMVPLPLGVYRNGRRYPFVESLGQDRFRSSFSTTEEGLSWLSTVQRVQTSILSRLVGGNNHPSILQFREKEQQEVLQKPLQPSTIGEWCSYQDPFEVIGRHVKLGTNGQGYCPIRLHHTGAREDRPSLKVYKPVKPGGYCWYCHTWGKGGSVFDFLRLYHGLEAKELWRRILSGESF